MSPQLRMLLWKEWRERRTQFLVCLVWMVGGTIFEIAERRLNAHLQPITYVTSWYPYFMPVFIAMRTSLGETTERTRSFASALPVSGQRWSWVRLAGGLIVLAAPMLLSHVLTVFCMMVGWFAPPAVWASVNVVPAVVRHASYAAIRLSEVTSLYVLLSLVGTALGKEVHAGFVGAAVATLWYLGTSVVSPLHYYAPPEVAVWIDAIIPRAMFRNYGYDSRRGLCEELWLSSAMLVPLLFQAGLQLAMAVWFVRRCSRRLPGRAVEIARRVPSVPWRPLPFRFPSRSAAVAWLTLRQALPMCLPGLAIAFLMTAWLVLMRFTGPAIQQARQRGELWDLFADTLPTSVLSIGLLWSVVVGAVVFSAEVDWRIGEFWRTRPIPFRRFFLAKFFVGLLAVLLVLDTPTFLLSWSFRRSFWWVSYKGLNWPYLACVVPLHAVTFATAVAWTCALRRPVLGGIAAIVSFALFEYTIHWTVWSDAAVWFDPITLYEGFTHGWVAFGASDVYPLVAEGMAALLIALFMVAGCALGRYDPRRQSG